MISTPAKSMNGWREVFRTLWRLLTFRASQDELRRFETDVRFLVLGLACTWFAGIGRWWDDPNAQPLQQTGIGSVIYVFVLASFLWLLIRPLKPQHWSWRGVLTLVTLTAPPAFIYALPVERWLGNETALQLNLMFLGVVATWRVALLTFYLLRLTRIGWFSTLVATLLPLSIIAIVLGVLNEMDQIMKAMGGLRNPGTNDPSLSIVRFVFQVALISFFPLALAYAWLCFQPRHNELN